jgi:transketolase
MSDDALRAKAREMRQATLRIHRIAPQTRLASSLSAVEIFVALYQGGVLRVDPKDPLWEDRDRLIISKGHGAIAMYPVLADMGFFPRDELDRVCAAGSFLGGIPDALVPGFETVNGSLGHGPGVSCGVAMGLKYKGSGRTVFCLVGDGELYEGSVWEAVMFAGGRRLDNLVLIVDNNKVSMLDFCREILDLEPLEEKFRAWGWAASRVDGHDVAAVHEELLRLAGDRSGRPKVLVADTVKGKGVPSLENDPCCHFRVVPTAELAGLIGDEGS